MKIVFLVDWHSEKMGYSDNFMPAALARLGHEVHLITTNHQVYFNTTNRGFYSETLESFLGPGIVPVGYEFKNGVHIHRLNTLEIRRKLYSIGLIKILKELQPDIVQSGEFISLQTYVAAAIKPFLNFSLFVECHTHASVFPASLRKPRTRERISWYVFSKSLGKFLNNTIEKCFAISNDAARIVQDFYGISADKIEIRSLGVDTNLFVPANSKVLQEQRMTNRSNFGFEPRDIVCVYSGRLNSDKNPLLLAKAVEILIKEGLPFKSFFIGNGPKEYISEIANSVGAQIQSYVTTSELPQFYRMADIAVWPAQESTSQLDALGCGLPLILGNKVEVTERIFQNGQVYEQGNCLSLVNALRNLVDPKIREDMGLLSRSKAVNKFSWDILAKKYETDYMNSRCNRIA
jgi:glycosyltransferase involved in cell wall biosynthesis